MGKIILHDSVILQLTISGTRRKKSAAKRFDVISLDKLCIRDTH